MHCVMYLDRKMKTVTQLHTNTSMIMTEHVNILMFLHVSSESTNEQLTCLCILHLDKRTFFNNKKITQMTFSKNRNYLENEQISIYVFFEHTKLLNTKTLHLELLLWILVIRLFILEHIWMARYVQHTLHCSDITVHRCAPQLSAMTESLLKGNKRSLCVM